jgi:hypothetical protein
MTVLREVTAVDIRRQAQKILRGLGNPEPPLNLDNVRLLLQLDRHYYSSQDDGLFRERISRLKVAGKQVLARPALLGDAIKKFDLKALYLPDSKRIVIDSQLPVVKQRWSEAHEIGHSIIPWHAETLMGDNKQTLTPRCHQIIEAEANYAAGQLLFFADKFECDARDCAASIATIQSLKRRYGNSLTTTIWRYVEQTDIPMIAGISQHPHRTTAEFSHDEPFRYLIYSRPFVNMFAAPNPASLFSEVKKYCGRQSGGPLGSNDVLLPDSSGKNHLFRFDTFFNTYEALTLGVHRSLHSVVV